MTTIRKGDKCEWGGCQKNATSLAAVREGDGVAKYCDIHYLAFMDALTSEYTAYCPNCGCGFGIN